MASLFKEFGRRRSTVAFEISFSVKTFPDHKTTFPPGKRGTHKKKAQQEGIDFLPFPISIQFRRFQTALFPMYLAAIDFVFSCNLVLFCVVLLSNARQK